MKCLTNDEVSITRIVIQSAPWVDKRLFLACLAISPECIQCSDIVMPSFTAQLYSSYAKLLEAFMVCILHRKSFVLEACSVSSNVVPLLNRKEHYVSLLTWHYENQDLNEVTEEIPQRQIFLILDSGRFLQAPDKNQNSVWERNASFFRIWQKIGLVSFLFVFNGIPTFVGYLMPNPS